MNRPVRKFSLLLLSNLIAFILVAEAFGLENFVVGGQERSWDQWVYRAGAKEGVRANVVDFKVNPGWVQPVQIDPKTNISLQTLARGGSVTSPNVFDDPAVIQPQLNGIVSGDTTIAFQRRTTGAQFVNPFGVIVVIDLGARFGVNRIKFFPRMSPEYPFQDDFMRGYDLSLNDGTPQTMVEGIPIFNIVRRVEENKNPIVDINLPLQYVRYIRIKSLKAIGWEIDEVQVFGTGFVPEASYESKVIDFQNIANFGKIRWGEQKAGNPQDSRIVIQTRTGNDDTPYLYNKLTPEGEVVLQDSVSGGKVVFTAEELFYKLKPAERDLIIDADIKNWSVWSPPYQVEPDGTPILSPGPRQYLQFRIGFSSTNLNAAGTVDSVSIEFSRPPVAHRIVAKITPNRVTPGEVSEFKYVVKPRILGNDTGFDGFQIATSVRANEIGSVKINGQDVNFTRTIEENYISVKFPKITKNDSLAIVFKGIVLRYGTSFIGKAFESTTKELPQLTVDEASDVTINDVSVTIALGGDLIRGVATTNNNSDPINVFTPNGDGKNDVVFIDYNLLQLTKAVPTTVKIFDLTGTLVRTIYAGTDMSGKFRKAWDGKSDDGNLLPPGIYIIQITAKTDSGVEKKTSIVSVAY